MSFLSPRLIKLLQTSPKEYYELVFDKDYCAYKTFTIAKKQKGSFRRIDAPKKKLREILSNLSQEMTKHLEITTCSHGFHQKKSIITNAEKHAGKNWILNLDLKDFFPSITEKRVFGAIKAWKKFCVAWGLEKKDIYQLAKLCCFEGKLPQGAPTSPVLSNLVARRLDQALKHFALRNNFTYTRYADDITFSPYKNRSDWTKLASSKTVNEKTSLFLSEKLLQIIKKNGFIVNDQKIRLQKQTESKIVTGLVVNQRVNVKRKFIKQTRAMLNAWEKYGLESADREFREKFESKERYFSENELYFDQVVLGKINFIGMVRGKGDPIYLKLRERIIKLDPNCRNYLKPQLGLNGFCKRYDWDNLKKEEIRSQREYQIKDKHITSNHVPKLVEIVYQLGLAKSQRSAKSCIEKGEILVNGKPKMAPGFIINKGDEIGLNRRSFLNIWALRRVELFLNERNGLRKVFKDQYLFGNLVVKAELNFLEKSGRWIENIETWSDAWNRLVSILGDEVGKQFSSLPEEIARENRHLKEKLSEYYKENLCKKFKCRSGDYFLELHGVGKQENKRGQGLAVLNLWVALAYVKSDDPIVITHAKRFRKAHEIEREIGGIFNWLQDKRNKRKRKNLSPKEKLLYRENFYKAWIAFGAKLQ